VSALGGVNITSSHGDLNMFFVNPALLEAGMHNHASANYFNYMADIGFSSASYATNFADKFTLGAGILYMGYGRIDAYDEAGNEMGEFIANEFAVVTGGSHKLGNFSIGSNLKIAGSNIASFKATALMLDLGAVFIHPEQDLKIGLVMQNIGFFVQDYENGINSRLPFDARLGITFKPEHAPIRISLTGYNLATGGRAYFDPVSRFGNNESPGVTDKIFRRINFGTEILLSKNVNLRAGYNHLNRKELKLEKFGGLAGFSWGMLFRIKAFEFSYANQIYHVAGGAHYFGITSNLNSFFKTAE
jgi:hypothetical protein